MTATDSAQLTFQALKSVRGSCASFSRIRIVIYLQEILGAFIQEHQRVMQPQKQDLPVPAPTAMTSSGSEPTVHIFVTGANEIAVSSTLEYLKTGFSEACICQVISDECVSQLSDKQVTFLLQNSNQRLPEQLMDE